MPPTRRALEQAILTLVARRGESSSACPSEVARALGGEDWRALMPAVRRAAAGLQDRALIAVTQRGRTVEIRTARGPIRLRCPRSTRRAGPG